MPLLASAWPPSLGYGPSGGNGTAGGDPGDDLASNWSSLIGIVTAIVGNMLIALALNVQRYAHLRLRRERQQSRERAQHWRQKHGQPGHDGSRPYGSEERRRHDDDDGDHRPENNGYGPRETDPLIAPESRKSTGTAAAATATATATHADADVEDAPTASDGSAPDAGVPTTYLRSPYWWLGQVLITIGEMGNFLAYGFAPASIVSPLGVVALVSNCVMAPILFKEPFRTRDFWGVAVAIGGVVTVVLSANQQETKLNPHDVWDAITTPAFEIYMAVTGMLIALLMWASPRYGHRTILIDLGLVGLFGGYTVLATKGVSSMLSSTLLGAFLTPMTYGLLFLLLATAVMQVRYVNKALQRFDSTQVIPIQFVTFTLSVIVGSAVLYRDFERTTAEQAAKFVGGCLLTFFGVFIITSGRSPGGDDGDDSEEEVEDDPIDPVEDGVTIDDHTALAPQTRRSSSSRRSARSSFAGRPFPAFPPFAADTGVPSARTPGLAAEGSSSSAATAVPLLAMPSSVSDDGSDAGNTPRATSPTGGPSFLRPGLGAAAFSADSVLHAISASGGSAHPTPPPPADRPVTPATLLRAAQQQRHSYHAHPSTTPPQSSYSYYHPKNTTPMISPSPLLSATVSAVVADTILKHMDGSGTGSLAVSSNVSASARRPSTRRVRPGLAASLFVPQDELLLDDAEQQLQARVQAQAQARPQAARSLGAATGGLFWPRRTMRTTDDGGEDGRRRNSHGVGDAPETSGPS